ncbi:uncharacterized protein TNCV_4583091 [Trichonephila clavipes]|nr:uncharacterized protein TNCV_4583091 [Trichonephila clavipes]
MPDHTLHVTRNNALQSYDENFLTTPLAERISHQMNFPLFKQLKSFLADKKFQDDAEIRPVVTQWLQSQIVRVHYFVRGGFVGNRSRVSSKHLSSHLPVDGVRFLGGQKGVALQLQDARVGVGSNKDADRS